MNKILSQASLFAFILTAGCLLGFTSCSDDDDIQNQTEITAADVYGSYNGRMTTAMAQRLDGESAPEGVSIKGEVKDDSVYFDNFPIDDIVLAVVGDETLADNIVKALGVVSYKIGYVPAVSSSRDHISLAFQAEPLKLSLTLPTENAGEEPQTLSIEVETEISENGTFRVEDGNLTFSVKASRVYLGDGEDKVEMEDLVPTLFSFDMNQYRLTHHL